MHDPLYLSVLSALILTVTTIFIGVSAREPWWRHQFGQSVMALAAAVWIFSLLSVLRQLLGSEYVGRVHLLTLGRVLVLIAITQRLAVLLRARRRPRARKKEPVS